MKRTEIILFILFQLVVVKLLCQPIANFSIQSSNICAPKIVQFNDLSSGYPSSWFWDFGNGNTSVLKNPQAVYQLAGTYTVKLIVSNQLGSDTLIKPYFIDVYAPPISNFYTFDTIGCFPYKVSFFDNSMPQSSAISEWYWDFGDGFASTIQNPTHTYSNGGLYTIYLNVKDANNCQHFYYKNQYIKIHELDASFNYSFENCKLPETLNLTNTSAGNNLNYTWYFGDNNTSLLTSPSHVYENDGNFNIVLIATNEYGCKDTASKTIEVINFQSNFNYSLVCNNDSIYTINFTDASSPSPSSSYWDFGDNTTSIIKNPSHNYLVKDSYSTTLISTLNDFCIDTVVKTYIPPLAEFEIDSILSCEPPFIISFINKSQGTDSLSFFWDFGDGTNDTASNPTHTYYSAKVPYVSLHVYNKFGCSDSIQKMVKFLVPFADFSCNNDSGCVPLTVTFKDSSISILSAITSYKWDFGDNSSGADNFSTLESPVHTYLNNGQYTVSLIVYTNDGCTDTITKVNYINAGMKPNIIDFSIFPNDTICHHSTLFFYDQTSYSDTSISPDHWCWEFNLDLVDMDWYSDMYPEISCKDTAFMDVLNSLATVQNPQHYYGNVDATANILNYYGTSMYYFEYLPKWGNYYIGLIAGYNACLDTVIKQITTLPPSAIPGYLMPVSQGTSTLRCSPPATYGFYNASIGWDKFYYLTVEDIQSGNTLVNITNTNDTVIKTFNKAGIYRVKIAVHNDSSGCTTETIHDIILDSVYYGFSVNPLQACISDNEFYFNDTTVSFFGKVEYWFWDFGDGKQIFSGDTAFYSSGLIRFKNPYEKTDSLKKPEKDDFTYGTYGSPIHVYTDTGMYIVKSEAIVKLGNNKYCSYITTDTIFIQGSYANISYDSIACRDIEINFTDSSYTTNKILYYNWDFGDSSLVSYLNHPTHIYSDTGYYQIKLLIRDSLNCIDSAVGNIRIFHPIARFTTTYPEFCMGDTVAVLDSSFGDTLSYYWNFSNYFTDTIMQAKYIYNQPGNYVITEFVTDIHNCKDSINNEIVIHPKPEPYFYSTPLWIVCPPSPVVFFDTSATANTSWFWDFGDQAFSLLSNPEHVYTIPGEYNIKLVVTNQFNCKDSIIKNNYIEVGGPKGTINFKPDTICIPDSITFLTHAIHTNYYLWDMGDGVIFSSTENTDSIIYTYKSSGIYTPSLTLQDSLGCTYLVPSDKKVFVDEIIADFTQSDSLYCYSENILFSNSSSINFPANYYWDFGDNEIENTFSPIHTFDSSGNYNIFLSVTSNLGCSSSISKNIIINKIPDFKITFPNKKACTPYNFNFKLQNNTTNDIVNSVFWDFGNGFSTSGFDVSHTYIANGSFIIKATYQYAEGRCIKDTTSTLTLYEQPVAGFSFSPLHPSMNEPTIQFTDQSSNASEWFWIFGNNDSSEIQNPSCIYQNSGEYIITQIVSNEKTCYDTIIHKIYITSKDVLKLPLAFTPNGDGLNDIFSIIYSGNVELFEFKIFNRWGEMVFETNNINSGWDGTFKGKLQETGTFSYYFIAKTSESESRQLFKGNVELIR